MGWTVLYIAFGLVALWLLGEVLLQYKARLRWRLLAFVGFLCVVIGVALPSVVVIAVGAVAFAVGQTYVTLSFRRGFSTGWALGGRPGASRRRKAAPGRAAGRQEPTLKVSDVEYEPTGTADAPPLPDQPPAPTHEPEQPPAPIYEPEPLPEDTGQYGVYGTDTAYTGTAGTGYTADADSGYADTAYGYPPTAPADSGAYAPGGSGTPADAYASASAEHTGYGTGEYGYDDHAGYDQQYGYDTGRQAYGAYSADAYTGAAQDGFQGAQGYGTDQHQHQQQHQQYDPYGQQYAGAYPAQDPYASASYETDTPPGGVWMPQQRATEAAYGGELPPEQPYPYQDGANGGHPSGEHPHGGYDPTGYDDGYHDQQYRY
ncbi:hypothetical protein GCM10018793_15060 [Streptomyces sulfonofaciens]|uniref:Uncharacterized protein n=1 Tax=Streptomyces sulfonofaciens TaxID=68272 RepID=A0A919FYK2_9ACTN|nr:hypothetical protein [Streptomyces sulfonofaciens]GHH74269.1 hypothetical protein GCM10018793_15060 [Streptomyces sulfonofaciens]